jgi:hypothetical protein
MTPQNSTTGASLELLELFVVEVSGNNFGVSYTSGGDAISLTSGSGTHYVMGA